MAGVALGGTMGVALGGTMGVVLGATAAAACSVGVGDGGRDVGVSVGGGQLSACRFRKKLLLSCSSVPLSPTSWTQTNNRPRLPSPGTYRGCTAMVTWPLEPTSSAPMCSINPLMVEPFAVAAGVDGKSVVTV